MIFLSEDFGRECREVGVVVAFYLQGRGITHATTTPTSRHSRPKYSDKKIIVHHSRGIHHRGSHRTVPPQIRSGPAIHGSGECENRSRGTGQSELLRMG